MQESHLVALAVGKEVCSLAIARVVSRRHTSPTIPSLHLEAETIPTRARPTGSYYPRVGKGEVDWEHGELRLVGGTVV